MATLQNQKKGRTQNRKKSLIPPSDDPYFFRDSHGYWEYPDPVIGKH